MSGRVGDLSQQQNEALEKFKNNIKDVLQPHMDDVFLLKWLRARSFNLVKAEEMFRLNQEFRKRQNVDNLKNEFKVPEVLTKYFTGGLFCWDKEGCPVFYDPFGQLDVRGMLQSVQCSDIIKFKLLILEEIWEEFRAQSEKLGRHVEGITLVIDLDNFGMRHMSTQGKSLKLLRSLRQNYPETLKAAMIIRAPRVFPVLYSLVRPFLSEDTKSKLYVCGSKLKELLLQKIDAHYLPAYWGGTATDPDGDPKCRSKICFGGTVPKSYYSLSNESAVTGNLTTATVQNGSCLTLEYDVLVPNCVIRWQFKSDHHDIKFGVYMRKRSKNPGQKGEELKAVVPPEKHNCHKVLAEGEVLCAETGLYVVKFDNSYSWITSKKLHYNIELIVPSKETFQEVKGAAGQFNTDQSQDK
ncbi:PREDICTED: SEC14-like protein 2 [Branchiostoma belcheri]|uniref:SEC14-like protein 2 n=1 Tax=Branchiostoma belcheri TaxID=7741 RepID=A0A6P4YJT2_BRABE|nr:PREDICTED: SEC14-like protein 2 [Branchiostoma belcheri]